MLISEESSPSIDDIDQRMEGAMKRSRHTIISQVLNICIGGASKTKIVYQANLNFRTVNPYIELLTKNGLINIRNGSTVIYETTEKGKALLDSIRQVQNELSKT